MYDVVIIGSGPAGYSAAIRAGQLGMRTALVDKGVLGGMCVNWGCVPLISLMESMRTLKKVRSAADYGVVSTTPEKASLDWVKAFSRAGFVADKVRAAIRELLDRYDVEIITAEAALKNRETVIAGNRSLVAGAIVIATGALPPPAFLHAPGPALGGARILELWDIYNQDKLPDRIALWGGSSAALEFAQFFAAAGKEAIFLEDGESLFSYMDGETAGFIQDRLSAEGVVFAKASGYTPMDENREIIVNCGKRNAVLPPMEFELEVLNGFIRTEEDLSTSVAGVFAAGEVNGGLMFAHAASAEGYKAINVIAGIREEASKHTPIVLFTVPEVAQIGQTEEECRRMGFPYKSSRFSLKANARAIASGGDGGFIKILYNENCGEVYGVHIVAENAADLIAEASVLLKYEGTVYDLAGTAHAHPSISELFMELGRNSFSSENKNR